MSYDLPPGPPPSGPPESIDSVEGAPIRQGGGRRGLLAVVAAIGVVGASWAVWSFFSTGPQPAEALPGSTIAYLSVDLDPSGGQKIEALRTLQKFPAFEEHVGLDTDDDVRKWIFEEVQGECAGLDYADDVEPWLGDRFAVAAVDVDADQPAPVFVLQVTDEDAAGTGLAAIKKCNDAAPDEGAWVIRDGWVVLAETQQIADQVADDAAEASLADDEDYQHWTDEAGDSGIVAVYAAPEAGAVLVEQFEDMSGMDDPEMAAPLESLEVLEDFKGAAATLRFDDGGLEFEVAADAGATGSAASGDRAGDVVASLPKGTVAALGMSFGDDWLDRLLDQVAGSTGQSVDELVAEAEEQLGITLPEDAETLVGDAIALAIGADFDPESLESGPPTGVGVKILGDPDDIESVLDRLRTAAAGADEGALDSDAGDGVVAIGPDADFREELLSDGELGDSDTFDDVVERADDAAAVLYVDFDAGDNWLVELAGDDPEVRDNLEPLRALGISGWLDGDTSHGVLKITTD